MGHRGGGAKVLKSDKGKKGKKKPASRKFEHKGGVVKRNQRSKQRSRKRGRR
jgi:hypothetical protein